MSLKIIFSFANAFSISFFDSHLKLGYNLPIKILFLVFSKIVVKLYVFEFNKLAKKIVDSF